MGYKLCPRCELNYIEDSEQYCGVCKAELKIGPRLIFAVDEEEEETEKLCPVCKQNYILQSADMCEQCREDSLFVKDVDIDPEKDEDWKSFIDDDEKDEIIEKESGDEMISLSELAADEAKEIFDDEEDFFDDDEEEVEPVEEEADDFNYEVDEKDFEIDDEEDDEKIDSDDEDDDDDF